MTYILGCHLLLLRKEEKILLKLYNRSQVVDTGKVEWHICGVKEKVSHIHCIFWNFTMSKIIDFFDDFNL
jgi:hypothetical protein